MKRRGARSEAEGEPRSTRGRREVQREVAERSIGNFARSSTRDPAAVGTTPTGMPSRASLAAEGAENWPGPFSTARAMIAQREEARTARLEALANQGSNADPDDEEREADVYELILQSLQWAPQGSFKVVNEVPSLTHLCLDVLVDNFEAVEELGDISEESRSSLLEKLAAVRKLTPEALKLVLDVSLPLHLTIPECSTLSEDSLQDLFERYSASDLKAIRMMNCGFGFTDKTALKAETVCSSVEVLQLTGMYRISDQVLANFLQKCLMLRDLDLSSCSKVGRCTIDVLMKLPSLNFISLNDIPLLNDDDLAPLLHVNKLEGISLRGLNLITDDFMGALLERFGSKLRKLNINSCSALSDVTCLAMLEHCRVLHHLDISHIQFSSPMLQKLLGETSDGSNTSIGQLEVVALRAIDAACDDVVIQLCLSHGLSLRSLDLSSSTITGKSLVAIAKHCPRLEHLDLSFVRGVKEDATGALMESTGSLRSMSVWGCSQFSRRIAEAQTHPSFKLQGLLPREFS